MDQFEIEEDKESEENENDEGNPFNDFRQPRLLRGHPRWAPTNNVSDMNCFYFWIPIPKRSYGKKQHFWLTQQNDLTKFENKKRLENELIYFGSFMDCIRLKYLSKNIETQKILIDRYGTNEPLNTYLYQKNHKIFRNKFRKRPPKYFDNPLIPNWRYKQLKYESNSSLANMEFEWIHKQNKKWKKYYKYCWIRGKIKKFILNNTTNPKTSNVSAIS